MVHAHRFRFAITTAISSILTCLAYVGIIKAKLPEPMKEGFHWQVAMFYICASLTMVLSLYNLVVTSFYLVQGQGLALHGAPGSIVRAVGIFGEEWRIMRIVFIASLLSFSLAGISLSWMKLDDHIGCMEAGEACECEGGPVPSRLPRHHEASACVHPRWRHRSPRRVLAASLLAAAGRLDYRCPHGACNVQQGGELMLQLHTLTA